MILHKSFLYEDLMLKKHLVILSMFKTVVLLNIFVDAFFDEYNIQKEEIGTSFTVPSNLFNASLLNKHIDLFFFKNHFSHPKFFERLCKSDRHDSLGLLSERFLTKAV